MKTAVWFLSLLFSHSSGDIALHCVCVSVCFHVHHLIKVRMRVPEQQSPLHGTQVFKALGQMLKASTAVVSPSGKVGHRDPTEISLRLGHAKAGGTERRERSEAQTPEQKAGANGQGCLSCCLVHHRVRSLLPFSTSNSRGLKSP